MPWIPILPIQKIHGCCGHLGEKKDLSQLLGLEVLLVGLQAEMLGGETAHLCEHRHQGRRHLHFGLAG